MTEIIRTSSNTFLVKEKDEFEDNNEVFILSYNSENSTRDFLTKKDWEEASKKFPIEILESNPELLYAWEYIEKIILEEETEMANWDFSGHT